MKDKLLPKIMDLLLDTICVVDEQGQFVYVSASCEELFGYTREELEGRNMIELVHPDDRERTLKRAAMINLGQPSVHFENRYIHKDGHVMNIMWSARWSEADRLRLAVARDVTPLKYNERIQAARYQIAEAGQSSDGLATLCEQIHRIINDLIVVRNFSVVLYNHETNSISIPYCVGDLACGDCAMSVDQPQALAPDSPMAQVIRSGEPFRTTLSVEPGPDACSASREWLGVPLSTGGGVMGALVIQGSINAAEYTPKDQELLHFVSTQIAAAIDRKQAEMQLRHLAGHDPLTDLPNRNLFEDRLEVAINRARRDKEQLALLYLDLDEFKQINDKFGHETGDEVLREVSRRLRGCLRESDTVGRMGGDEFTVLLANIQGPECVPGVIEKIRHALKPPINILGRSLSIAVSVGSAIYPDHGSDTAQLLRGADTQMYRDKRQKRTVPIVPG